MAGNTVTIRTRFDDQVSKPLDKLRDKFDQLGKSGGAKSILQGVGMGAGIAAFNALGTAMSGAVSYVGDLVQGAMDEEAGIKKLTTALDSNVKGWDGNTDAIEKVIKKRVLLGFSDDEQRESLALLVGATGDVSTALNTQRTAMDLARLKSIPLKEASEALVRVEAGQYRMLKSLGIELPKNATQTDALAAVQRVAAGQAQAWGETTAGALSSMQLAIEDAGEEIMINLLPAIKGVAVFIRDDALPAMQEFGAALEGIAGTLDTKVGESLDGTSISLGEMNAGMNPLLSMVGGLTDAVGLLSDAFGGTDEAVEDSQAAIEDFRKGERNTNAAVTAGIVTPTKEALDKLDDIARKSAIDAVKALTDEIRDGDDDVASAIEAMNEAAKSPMDAEARLMALRGQRAAIVYGDNIKAQDPYLRTKTEQALGAVEDEILALEVWMKAHGTTASKAFAQGMIDQKAIDAIKRAAAKAAATVAPYFRGFSPPREGPLHEIDKWGENVGRTWAESFAEGVDIGGLLGPLPAPAIGNGGGRFVGRPGPGGGGSTFVYAPLYSAATPTEAARFAESVGPEVTRWMRRQGLQV